MSNDVQVKALRRVATSHHDWVEARHQLDLAFESASGNGGPLPMAELRSDYAAQRDLASAALAFAAICPPDGPELDGLAGAAFVLALFHAASPSRGLEELAELDVAMELWWPKVAALASVKEKPPARPRNTTLEQIIDAANNWMECLTDREADHMVDQAMAMGAKVTRILTPTGSGFRAEFSSLSDENGRGTAAAQVPEPVGTLRRDGSLGSHVARFWRAPLRTMSRNRGGEVELLSTHWTGTSAWSAAHKARLPIDPTTWIELWEWTFRGYQLVDVLPYLDPSEVTDDGAELVFGMLEATDEPDADESTIHAVGVIGTVSPVSRGWMITVRAKGTDELRVPRLFDSFYPTLAKAKAAVQELYNSK